MDRTPIRATLIARFVPNYTKFLLVPVLLKPHLTPIQALAANDTAKEAAKCRPCGTKVSA